MENVVRFLSPAGTIFTLFIFLLPLRPSESKSLQISLKDRPIFSYDGSYALVAGVSDYADGWQDLPDAAKELNRMETLLRRNGFRVTKVLDPDDSEMKKAFRDFFQRYGYYEDCRLLLFFSGHGYSRDKDEAYLVPANAPAPARDEKEFLRKALSMTQIRAWAKDLPAKHIFFIFDSC